MKTKIKFDGNCPACFNGSDGTRNHRGRAAYTVTQTGSGSNPNFSYYVCENHVQGYKGMPNWFTVVKNQTKKEKEKMNFDKMWMELLFPKKDTHNHQDLLEINRLNNVLRKIVSYGRNTALHTFHVASSTDVYLQYVVKQMLNGSWTCTCPSKKFGSGLIGGECKHIRSVKSNPRHANDISYGQGAIEAHKRLVDIARKGLANG